MHAASHLPADSELAENFAAASEVLLSGGSAGIASDGSCRIEPVRGRKEVVTAELDLDRTAEEKLTLDDADHYSRADVFELRVNRTPLPQLR